MSDFQDAKQETGRSAGGSRIIGRILPTAVQFWLRSQLEAVAQLNITLDGRDREIIEGVLPKVTVSAKSAIYQGIHLSSADLSAEDIRINIGQVVRGKPLKLLKSFPVLGKLSLAADDLSASMESPLLNKGLNSFWQELIRLPALAKAVEDRYGYLPLRPEMTLRDPQVAFGRQCFVLSFYPTTPDETADAPIILSVEIIIASGHLLRILSAKWLEQLSDLDNDAGEIVPSLEGFELDLGSDTRITQLEIQPSQLLCQGQLAVNP